MSSDNSSTRQSLMIVNKSENDEMFHSTEKSQSRKRKQQKRRFWLISIGLVMVFSGYNSFLTLQSSIRIEDGLGAKITTITYVLQIALNLFFAPFLVRLIGPKKAIILGDCLYIVYVLVNAFSNEVLLIIGAITASFAESIFWVATAMAMIFFAKKYHLVSTKAESKCIMEFSGMFYGMIEFNQVVGSSIVTIVLQLINKKPEPKHLPTPGFRNGSTGSYIHGQTTFLPGLLAQNATSPSTVDADYKYQYCGANDCQDAEIVEESIDQYVSNNTTLHIITGSFLLMMVLGMVDHIVLIPDMSLADCNELSNSEAKIVGEDKKSQKKTLKKVTKMSFQATKDMVLLLINPYQFFIITPYSLYIGLNLGFVLSEATRAYASCVLGVNSVGICIIIYAFFAAINAFMIGKVWGQRGLVPLIMFEIVFDLSLYSFCLLWRPTPSSTWLVYPLFGLLGIYNSTAGMINTNIYSSSFYKTKEVSLSLWCIVFAVGFSIQYGISTLLCVRYKIYMLMVWIVVAGILMVIFELRLRKRIENSSTKQELLFNK